MCNLVPLFQNKSLCIKMTLIDLKMNLLEYTFSLNGSVLAFRNIFPDFHIPSQLTKSDGTVCAILCLYFKTSPCASR